MSSIEPMAPVASPVPTDDRLTTAVCHLDAERGRLTYRGFEVTELAEEASFEEVAWLLVAGALPSAADLRAFRRAWIEAQRLAPPDRRWLRGVAVDADELVVLRTVVGGLSLQSNEAEGSLPGIPGDALRLLAQVPAIVAERLRVATGSEPPPAMVRAFDAALILRADNELNPGTYAARVAASTGADLGSCVVAAMGALAGPRHSGHTIAVARLLEEVATPDRATATVRALLESRRKPAGFGHPVYPGEDPRTPTARRLAEAASQATGRQGIFSLARAVEEAVHRESGARANVDYYLTVVYLSAGLPIASFAPLFAVARTSGWIAHCLEQSRDPDLIRPRARYVGPEEQHYLTTRRRPRRSSPVR